MKVSFVIPFRNGSKQLIPIETKLATMPEKNSLQLSVGDLHALAGSGRYKTQVTENLMKKVRHSVKLFMFICLLYFRLSHNQA